MGAKPTADQPGHVVLLGDSIFDNQAYVGQGPAVIDQLSQALDARWQATLLAVDGDVTGDVEHQLKRLPPSATHLVISAGGNDALQNHHFLSNRVEIVAEAFLELAEIQDSFGAEYERMLDVVATKCLPTIVCTVYDPNFDDTQQQRMTTAALSAFNDRITRAAFARGLPVIDLRLLFSGKEDYANPIEPAPPGGAKIVDAIVAIVNRHDFNAGRAIVYVGP